MSVPRGEARRRNESTSSGCGSWTQVGATGSLMTETNMHANMQQLAAASNASNYAFNSPGAAGAAPALPLGAQPITNPPSAGDTVPPVFEDDEMYDIMLL